jgi:hypothetical protein
MKDVKNMSITLNPSCDGDMSSCVLCYGNKDWVNLNEMLRHRVHCNWRELVPLIIIWERHSRDIILIGLGDYFQAAEDGNIYVVASILPSMFTSISFPIQTPLTILCYMPFTFQ